MKLCILVITTTTTYVMLVHWSPEGDYGRNIEVPSDTNISGTVKTQVVFAIRWRSVCEPVTKLLSWSCVHVCKKCWLYGETTTSCSQWRRHLQFRGRWFLYTHTLALYKVILVSVVVSQFVILFLLMLINKSSLLIVLCCACLLYFLLIFCIKYSANYIWYAFAATNAPSLSAKDLFSSTS